MKIFAFVEYYPSAYKAYYDAQFADLVRKGHDLNIFAIARLDSIIDGKVVEYDLHKRTRYFYPDDIRSLLRFAPQLVRAITTAPRSRRTRIAAEMLASVTSTKRAKHAIKEAARILTLPTEPPGLCLVSSHRTMALLQWLRKLYPEAPVALYYHGGEPKEAGAVDNRRTTSAFATADRVFAPTQFARAEAILRGADASQTFVLPVGFDIDDYRPAYPRRYRCNGVLHVISAGRLSEGKGHLYALEAISRLVRSGMHQIQYTIIGNGYMRPHLDEFVNQHHLGKHVHFRGTLANRDLIAALGHADVLLLPSTTEGTWTETQGAVVQEALLMKAVTITTQTGGVPESIPAVMQPFSVAPGDVDSLAACMERVNRLSTSDFQRLGEQGRRWAAEHYDIAALNNRLLRLSLLSE